MRDSIIVRTSIIGIAANLFLSGFKIVVKIVLGRYVKGEGGEKVNSESKLYPDYTVQIALDTDFTEEMDNEQE